MKSSCFRGECGCADDNAGYAHEMGDVGRCEATNGGLRDGRVDEELVGGEGFGVVEVFGAA